jgi:hypothetical protein
VLGKRLDRTIGGRQFRLSEGGYRNGVATVPQFCLWSVHHRKNLQSHNLHLLLFMKSHYWVVGDGKEGDAGILAAKPRCVRFLGTGHLPSFKNIYPSFLRDLIQPSGKPGVATQTICLTNGV